MTGQMTTLYIDKLIHSSTFSFRLDFVV